MQPTKTKLLILFSGIVALALFLVIYAALALARPNAGSSAKIALEVKTGENLSEVGRDLFTAKLINSETLFRLYAHFDKRGNEIKAGRYQIPGNLTINQILETLATGPSNLRITFIEGWRREQMAAAFAKVAFSPTSYGEFMKASAGLEGQLFPDTYIVAQQAAAQDLVDLLHQTFDDKVTAPLRTTEAVTLASLVEREAATDADRRLVAGIIMNRLRDGWLLGIDASVQYAVASQVCVGNSNCDWWPKNLTAADLKINSPFNTYINKGLPPTPICNPSLSALEAVASPTKSDYFYYLTDKNGVFHYAKTLEEHNANVARYL